MTLAGLGILPHEFACEHGVAGGCMACRPCQCGCLLDKHFIRFERKDGQPDTGCTVHSDCGGYLPKVDSGG